jgi:hypothetical protein
MLRPIVLFLGLAGTLSAQVPLPRPRALRLTLLPRLRRNSDPARNHSPR